MPNNSTTSNNPKYRPALTLEQITHIAHVMQMQPDDLSYSITRILVPLLSKINNQLISPAYTLIPHTIKPTHITKPSPTIIENNNTDSHNKPIKNQIKNGAFSEQYKYENDMMTQEEQTTYENKLLGLE